MRKNKILLLSAVILSGCAKPHIDVNTLNYGPEPDPIFLESTERTVRAQSFDPDSVQFRWDRPPFKTYIYRKLTGGDVKAGWGLCYSVNAKNLYGAYTGYRPEYILFNNGVPLYHTFGTGAIEKCSLTR